VLFQKQRKEAGNQADLAAGALAASLLYTDGKYRSSL